MKSHTILNQNKIHAFIFALTCAIALTPHTTNVFGCASDYSSCITSRYANTDGITLDGPMPTSQLGNPSPSTILVDNIPSCHVVKGLEVTLQGIIYGQLNRLAVALVGPCGDCIILLNNVGQDNVQIGADPNPPTSLTFSECKATTIDCERSENINGTFTFRPTDCAPGDCCFNGQLDTTFCTTQLSKTFGKRARGCWQLFTCIKPETGEGVKGGSIEAWKLKILHGLPAKDGCFAVFTSTCCGGPCNC